ncbi:MAG: hypothetical protein AAF394_11885, partial [Planctomycetota bacterium]
AGSGSSNIFAFGVAKSNEHAGAQSPQLRGEVQFNGTSLSIGGATDTGYQSGDSVDLTLTFARTGSSWNLETTIANNTDSTFFSGSDASPSDLAGSVSSETVVEWMDLSASNELRFGMRELGVFNNAASLGSVRVERFAVPEPNSFVIGLAFFMLRRRSRRSKH